MLTFPGANHTDCCKSHRETTSTIHQILTLGVLACFDILADNFFIPTFLAIGLTTDLNK